jgi:hypothetical protein
MSNITNGKTIKDTMDLMDTPETAYYLCYSISRLQKWRERNEGPPYLNMGGRYYYRKSDVDKWVAEHWVTPGTSREMVTA